MENTLENKARFFAQYFGVKNSIQRKGFTPRGNFNPNTIHEFDYLELKPLSQITDEDAIEVGEIINCSNYSFIESHRVEHEYLTHVITSNKNGEVYGGIVNIYDDGDIYWDYHNSEKYDGFPLRVFWAYQYLRSKGYALPYMGISVEQQIEWGWVKLKTE